MNELVKTNKKMKKDEEEDELQQQPSEACCLFVHTVCVSFLLVLGLSLNHRSVLLLLVPTSLPPLAKKMTTCATIVHIRSLLLLLFGYVN